ncbi:stage II sporulation protein R [Paenibacillus allorhizosphaerae]|nr:stage II sporulation protein R [Paenibacillus allorhizosphaerae]
MVKRFGWKRYAYIAFALMVMMTCWESNRSNAMLYASAEQAETASDIIPQESIRLRILANSDAPADQWVKREVRDAIIEQMNGWVTEPQGIEAARAVVREHLPELHELVGKTLRSNGFDYDYKVELGVVPFPTKMYGNQVYPAGDYEALRVSIGAAEGQNWWCVLFPPLCFVDSEMMVKKNTAHAAAADEADDNKASQDTKAGKPAKDAKTAAGKTADAGKSATNGKTVQEAGASKGAGKALDAAGQAEEQLASASAPKPEIRFFLWDLLKKVGSLFA